MSAQGGIYDQSFLRRVQPLYDMHMGVENMGPLLYSLVRFAKPRHVLEVGAGYTSIFILQALHDNASELANCRRLQRVGLPVVPERRAPVAPTTNSSRYFFGFIPFLERSEHTLCGRFAGDVFEGHIRTCDGKIHHCNSLILNYLQFIFVRCCAHVYSGGYFFF